MKDVTKALAGMPLPPGYLLKIGGEYENQSRAMGRLALVVPATLALLATLLFLLFFALGLGLEGFDRPRPFDFRKRDRPLVARNPVLRAGCGRFPRAVRVDGAR